MPKEHEKIKYLPGEKSLKVYNLCAFTMPTKNVRSCQNNPENSYTEKKVKHKPSGCAWRSLCSFHETKNRRCFYKGKDYIEKFCKELKELRTEIINFKEKEIIPLTNKEIESYENLGEYHDLHVQCEILLLADVFENFRDKFIEIYELDLDHFLSAPGFAWLVCLKKAKVKLESLTDNDMVLRKGLEVKFKEL